MSKNFIALTYNEYIRGPGPLAVVYLTLYNLSTRVSIVSVGLGMTNNA